MSSQCKEIGYHIERRILFGFDAQIPSEVAGINEEEVIGHTPLEEAEHTSVNHQRLTLAAEYQLEVISR